MTEDQLNPVDVLAEDFARRLKAGENPKIEEYAKKHPEHADTIRAMFPSIKMMERVSKQKRTEDEFERRTKQVSDKKTLGDFVIRRELGRGGMGIVYEAVQQSLKRRVALKVLAPHIADSETQLKRFRREAKSAAGLHHTNIVSVYGIGHADGLHFIAMQYIEGQSLQDKLTPDTQAGTNRPKTTGGKSSAATAVTRVVTDVDFVSSITEDVSVAAAPVQTPPAKRGSMEAIRDAARIIRDTADALAYAHEHGVQHRDIKPGNLLLDASGTVWVTDFGLAKHESDEAATKTGDIVGTLRYMAPEQFSGKEDARCDIYSLGLTLYEMLTHEPAYKSTKAVTLMQQKTNEPPPSPRLVVKNLPIDLETITLKACALNPNDRYQTARELEEDLNLYLEDRPILSRRVTPIERLWRWTKRNRLVAGLGVTTIALLATTAVVFAVGNYQTSKALAETEVQKKLVEQERNRAVSNFKAAESANERTQKTLDLALQAFDQIMSNISSRGSAQSFSMEVDGEEIAPTTSVVTAADAELLQTLLDFFARFSQQTSTDLSHNTADAYSRVGKIQNKLGQTTEAIAAFENSLSIYDELAAKDQTADYTIQRASIHRELIDLGSWRDGENHFLRHYRESAALLADDTAPESQFELALTRSALVSKYLSGRMGRETIMQTRPGRGRPPARFMGGMMRAFGRGGKRFNNDGPRRPRGEGPPPRPFDGNGGRPGGRGDMRDMIDMAVTNAANDAVKILTSLVEGDPTNSKYRLALGRAYRQLADTHTDDKAGAIDKAVAQFEWLNENAGGMPTYQFELAMSLCHPAARRAPFQGNMRRAKQAEIIARKLVRENADVPQYEVLLARAVLMGRRESPELWEEAIGIYRGLQRRFPTSFTYSYTLARYLHRFSKLVHTQDTNRAEGLVREAITVLDSMPSTDLLPEHRRIVQAFRRELSSLPQQPKE